MYYGWRPYVPAHVRRRRAEREMVRLRKKGQPVSPVVLTNLNRLRVPTRPQP